MKTKFVEVTQGAENPLSNWGKFAVGKWEEDEVGYMSQIYNGAKLLEAVGWAKDQYWVMDLQTCEAAAFSVRSDASASYDLNKHRIWVCPLFEPFLHYLYQQEDPMAIPDLVELPEAEFAVRGYRREGGEQS